jgi:hypothetical protein
MGTNEYVAEQLMEIKSETALLVFLATLWLGNHVMITWDRLNGGVMQIWGAENLTDEEIDNLDAFVWNYMSRYEENAY